MKYSTVVLLIMYILLMGCQKNQESQKRIVSYETKVIFIEDGSSIGISERMPAEAGWEIKSSSRIKKKNDLTIAGVEIWGEIWGTEYVLQKPIYEK